MELNNQQIQEILPHRYPFLLLDKVTDCKPGKSADAVKCVTAGESFFQGHFPGRPVMPGVLILEAMAQAGAVAMLLEEGNEGKIPLFAGVKNAKFKQQVVPGDVLCLHCELTRRFGKMGCASAEAKVNGKTAAVAEITFAIL